MSIKKLIVIADSHLGTIKGDVDQMIGFISSLDPQKSELLFLGDLFHIWAGPFKYRTSVVNSLMEALFSFRESGGISYMVAGNRDAFLPEKQQNEQNDLYPFSKIALEQLEIDLPGGKLIAVHGDTINSTDKQYLRWRALIRSKPFRWAFNLIPANRVKKILLILEENLKKTNTAFRKEFPEDEWQQFLESVYSSHSPDLLIAGHYHPASPIIDRYESMIGMIIPAWCGSFSYLEIDERLNIEFKQLYVG
ncbi:metallophosphoesterase [bacterium]|nr:metallophosphoesterase [bacterium]